MQKYTFCFFYTNISQEIMRPCQSLLISSSAHRILSWAFSLASLAFLVLSDALSEASFAHRMYILDLESSSRFE